ncbi:hypothetical protein TNCV_1106251 [Trichonephila clavipes]|nr:hypothetical protein TNCV_1106251 [Trichonephila clavipes]
MPDRTAGRCASRHVISTETESGFITEDDTSPVCQTPSCPRCCDGSRSHITTLAQEIQSVTHHSVSTRALRRHLQQSRMSRRRPLLRLPLAGNHKRLHRQWCDERWAWATE